MGRKIHPLTINEEGNKYGNLVVVEFAPTDKPGSWWLCKCKCGNEVIARGSTLRSGHSKSCKSCSGKSSSPEWSAPDRFQTYRNKEWLKYRYEDKGLSMREIAKEANCSAATICNWVHKHGIEVRSKSKPYGAAAGNFLFNSYRSSARARDLEWDLTEEQFAQLASQPCHYCGIGPSRPVARSDLNGTRLYNGVDRLDSNLGYIAGNCVPCCTDCNMAKGQMSKEGFLKLVNRIHQHQLCSS